MSHIKYNSAIPYNDLPLLPPQAEIENTVILKKTITASRALSELKGAITNLPNPTLFIDTINLQEAQASSAIENIVTKQKNTKLQSTRLFDVFESDKLGAGKKSMAVNFTFLDEEKTLTDKEIEGMMNKLIQSFEKEIGAEIRK